MYLFKAIKVISHDSTDPCHSVWTDSFDRAPNSCDIPAGFLLDIIAKQEIAGSISNQGNENNMENWLTLICKTNTQMFGAVTIPI